MKEIDYEKKILRLHLIYWAIIFVVLSAFLLLIAPGCVNQKAFENFSFASALISIVLAVVSIVYSFRTKSNASENIAGIREIERNIDAKLQKFDSLKTEIVEEVKSITRPIGDEVSCIRQDQMSASNQMKEMLEIMAQKNTETDETGGRLLNSTSFLGNVMMYMLCKSKQTRKEIDLGKMGLDFNDNYDYFWGFWIVLTALKGDPFNYEEKEHVITVTKFDETMLGDLEYWRSKINRFKYEEEVKKYMDVIDAYFQE